MSAGALAATPEEGRVLAAPPSLIRSGLQLPEVRWALLALGLFIAGWATQLADAPPALWWSLYLACYAAGGWEPTRAGLEALRDKSLDVDLLMIVAAIAAASIGQIFDGALLIVIFATSGALEVIVTQRTADSVSSLLGLAPEHATVIDETGNTRTIDSAELRPGDRVLIRPGERISADGTVVEGISEVDQQAVTGESVPIVRRIGDPVLSGTLNGTGSLTVEVTTAASESVIARIVTMVNEASESKAPAQLFIEKVEQSYSVIVVLATLAVLAIPMLFGNHSFDDALLRAIVFMIVASPCAVVLSTMPPLLASIANAGRHGVLVKSAAVMESVGRTSIVAFDKTGTLTEGSPEVSAVQSAPHHSDTDVLRLAAAIERYSEHPLGRAIVAAAAHRQLDLPETTTDFEAIPGRGVTGLVDSRRVVVERADDGEASHTTKTRVTVTLDAEHIGTIELVDQLRHDAPDAVAQVAALAESGVLLLTGDHAGVAADIAERTGITQIRTDLLPQDKARIVSDLESAGERVLLVGDGINDAPALARATTGVAMGRRGSDLALESADAIIVRDDLGSVAHVINLSRRARRYVVANLIIAAAVIVTLVTWDLVGTLPLPLAVAGHEGSTVVVALNGARLLRERAWRRHGER